MRPPVYQKCLFFLVIISIPTAGRADMILNSIGALQWEPVSQPGGLGPISVSVSSNASAPNVNVMNAFSVGLRLVGEAGRTGQLRVSSVSQPTTERVFNNYAAPLVVALQDAAYSISGDNAEFVNVPIPAAGRRFFEMVLGSQSASISGSFLIVADDPAGAVWFC